MNVVMILVLSIAGVFSLICIMVGVVVFIAGWREDPGLGFAFTPFAILLILSGLLVALIAKDSYTYSKSHEPACVGMDCTDDVHSKRGCAPSIVPMIVPMGLFRH